MTQGKQKKKDEKGFAVNKQGNSLRAAKNAWETNIPPTMLTRHQKVNLAHALKCGISNVDAIVLENKMYL